jgi:hypothetical protein
MTLTFRKKYRLNGAEISKGRNVFRQERCVAVKEGCDDELDCDPGLSGLNIGHGGKL